MARIRTIKPGFFKHGDLFDAEAESGLPLRIAYAGLWTIADREGRFKWKPKDIKPDVLPFDNVNMEEVLTALEAKAFIQTYVVAGQKYAWIPAFKEHQHVNIRELPSTIPEPPKNKTARAKRVLERGEGKGKEGNTISADADGFEVFWKAYPKREARGAAVKAYAKALEKTDAATILAAAGAYGAKRAGQDKQFTKLPATWLNQECWADDGVAPPAPAAETDLAGVPEPWRGLAGEIGIANFQAYFADAILAAGPPVRIGIPKPHIRAIVGRKFAGPLSRAFKDFELEAVA